MNYDTELFRRTKYASWSIRLSDYEDGDKPDVYAFHNECKSPRADASPWSWFMGENCVCFNCAVNVPDYIQTLVRLYIGR